MLKINFGYSKNKYYPIAATIVKGLPDYTVTGRDRDVWHSASIDHHNHEQLKIAAYLHNITVKFRFPCIRGEDIRRILECAQNDGKYQKLSNYEYAPNGRKAERVLAHLLKPEESNLADITANLQDTVNKIRADDTELMNALVNEGYIQLLPHGYTYTEKTEAIHLSSVLTIKNMIEQGKFKDAVEQYRDNFREEIIGNSVATNELIYLKRLADIELESTELVPLRSGYLSKVAESHISKFKSILDQHISELASRSLETPTSILKEILPTIEEMINEKEQNSRNTICLYSDRVSRYNTNIELSMFSVDYDKCLQGNIFEMFPDPVRRSEIIEVPESTKYYSLWTPIGFEVYNKEITGDLHLGSIECLHPIDKSYRLIKGDEIQEYRDNAHFLTSPVGGYGAEYTGRVYSINSKTYYEINVLRKNYDKERKLGNRFIELLDEIFRDSENKLRTELGLPKIGEGWVSEMELFRIVRQLFDDANHHVRLPWLGLQHLDIYVPSKQIAFEYQGKQHFEPVEYFGGKESFENTKKLDKRKNRLCKNNGVDLIYWHYDEPVTPDRLLLKVAKYL